MPASSPPMQTTHSRPRRSRSSSRLTRPSRTSARDALGLAAGCALLWLRPILYRVIEAQGARSMREFEPLAERDIAEMGDAAGEPVGPGGAAAVESSRRRATA